MSELKVNTITPYSGSSIGVNSNDLVVLGNITSRKSYIDNYQLDVSDPRAYSLVASKFYVDQQFTLRGIGATGISGLTQLQAGLSAEAQAIRAESDSKYLFNSRHNIHSSGGITFSGGPYRYGAGGTVLAIDNSNGRVGVGLLDPVAPLQVSGAFYIGNNKTNVSILSNDSSNNLIINSWNGFAIQNGGAEKARFFPTLATIKTPLVCTGDVDISDTTDSGSTGTGALIVEGGVGIAKNLNVGGFIGLTASDPSANTNKIRGIRLNGALVFSDSGYDSGLSGNLHPYGLYQEGGPWTSTYPDYRLDAHTGLKIVAHTNYGGTRFYSSYLNTNTSDILFSVGQFDNNVRVRDRLLISGTTTSTSTSSGALTVAGGVGVTENLYVGGVLNVASNASIGGALTISSSGASANGLIKCSTAPVVGADLVNKSYVDGSVPVTATSSTTRVGSFVFGAHNLYSGTIHISNSAVSFTPPTASTQYGTLNFPSGQSWSGGGIAMNNNAAANSGFTINTAGGSNTVQVDYYTPSGLHKCMMFFAYRTA